MAGVTMDWADTVPSQSMYSIADGALAAWVVLYGV